jgi:hypothetical protein
MSFGQEKTDPWPRPGSHREGIFSDTQLRRERPFSSKNEKAPPSLWPEQTRERETAEGTSKLRARTGSPRCLVGFSAVIF